MLVALVDDVSYTLVIVFSVFFSPPPPSYGSITRIAGRLGGLGLDGYLFGVFTLVCGLPAYRSLACLCHDLRVWVWVSGWDRMGRTDLHIAACMRLAWHITGFTA